MQHIGDFNLVWTSLPTVERAVTCRELPGFKIFVSECQDLQDRLRFSLENYLTSKFGARVQLTADPNHIIFRCMIPG